MTEVISKRRIDSKTYSLGNNKFHLTMSREPLHYLKDGKLEDIDLTPRSDGGDFLIDKAPVTVRVKPGVPAYRFTSERGEVAVELVSVGGKALRQSTATTFGSSYRWTDIALDTDYEIIPKAASLFTFCVLKSADAPRTWTWETLGDTNMLRSIEGVDATGRKCEIVTELNGDLLTATWTGRTTTQRALRARPKTAYTDEVTYPVRIDPSITQETITVGGDDVQTIVGDGFFITRTTIIVGTYGFGNYTSQGGFRFQTIPVPVGATIDSATMTLEVVSKIVSPQLTIWGDDVDDAAIWADDGSNRPENITKTTASVAWHANSTGSIALNVQPIVAEICARGGWASNNDIRFSVLADGGGTGYEAAYIAALEHSSEPAALFDITYTEATASFVPSMMIF